MSFTFGIEIPEAPPLAYSLTQDVMPPAAGSPEPWPDFLYTVVLDVPKNARRAGQIDVDHHVVDKPESGMWGGAAHDLKR